MLRKQLSKCCILLLLGAMLCGTVQAAPWLSGDLAPWAAEQVEDLKSAGLFQGMDAGHYAATAPITRGEFCHLLVNLLQREADVSGVPPEAASYFADIRLTVTDKNPGGVHQMYYAAAYGLTEGAGVNGRREAQADGKLTREQGAKMTCSFYDALARYAGLELPSTGSARTYADAASISSWARPYVDRATLLGTFLGDDGGRFNPGGTLSWQEACVMLDRIFMAAELASEPDGVTTLHTAMSESKDRTLARSGDLYYLEHDGMRSVLQIHGPNFYDSTAVLETYDASGQSTGTRDLLELDFCGGFYESADSYYLAFGQDNMDELAGRETFRIVRYDKAWNRLGAASVTGSQCYTTKPYDFSTHTAMAEHDGTLILHTARQRFLSSDGLRHQSNITITVRVSDMSVLDVSTAFPWNHVSHSFAQYAAFDHDDPVFLDQGDGYPRGFVISTASGSQYGRKMTFFRFHGEIGDNATNATPGGFGISPSGYLFAGASSPQRGGDSLRYRNTFVAYIPREDFPNGAAQLRWLTDYPQDGKEYVAAIKQVQLNNNTFVVMWQTEQLPTGAAFPSFGDFCYAVFDGKGNQIGQVMTKTGFIAPDSDPTVIGNRIVWVRPEKTDADDYYVYDSRLFKVYTLDITPNAPAKEETPPSTAPTTPPTTPAATTPTTPAATIPTTTTTPDGTTAPDTSTTPDTTAARPAKGTEEVVTAYRETYQNGDYMELEIVNKNTLRLSGRMSGLPSYYNYVVLRYFYGSVETPLVKDREFSLQGTVDVRQLQEYYESNPVARSSVTPMVCQNYTPGDTAIAGLAFQDADVWLGTDGNGGCVLHTVYR